MKTFAAMCLALGMSSVCWGDSPLAPMDAITFAETATELMVVKCLDADTSDGSRTTRAFQVEVDALSVIKGDLKPGRQELLTISNPMEAGKIYLMAVFRTDPNQPVYRQRSDQAFTEISPEFDLKSLAGKTPPEQARTIFEARRNDVDAQILKLEKERSVLEAALPASAK